MGVRKFLQVRKEKEVGEWQMPVKINVSSEFFSVVLVLLMLIFLSMGPHDYIS